jgi:hypothetical protein
MHSKAVFATASYSASALDLETAVCYCFDDHEIKKAQKKKCSSLLLSVAFQGSRSFFFMNADGPFGRKQ